MKAQVTQEAATFGVDLDGSAAGNAAPDRPHDLIGRAAPVYRRGTWIFRLHIVEQ